MSKTKNICEPLWDKKFALFLQYIEKYHHVPAVDVEYKKVKIGRWYFNQISLNKIGRLSEERIQKLQNGFPCWEGSYAERKEYIRQQIIKNWLTSGEKEKYEHPITMLLNDENDLCDAIINKKYSVETYMEDNRNIHLQEKGICLLYPDVRIAYVRLLAYVMECDILDLINDMLQCYTKGVSSIYKIDYENLVENMDNYYLPLLTEKQQTVYSYYFGLRDTNKNFREIGRIMGQTSESIRVILKQGAKTLRSEAARFFLQEKKDQVITEEMPVSSIVIDEKLLVLLESMDITTVADLVAMYQKMESGEKLNKIGIRRGRKLQSELKNKRKYIKI